MVDIIMLLFFAISWIINHFGRNPVSGGRPPRDNIVIKMIVVIRGNLFHVCDSEVVVVEEVVMRSKKVVIVIGM